MRFQLIMLIMLLTQGLSVSSARATTLFFDNDLAGFNALTTTTLTDFEGVVADTGLSEQATFSLANNTYSNSTGSGDLLLCGKNGCNGQPFDSAVLAANGSGATIRIDLGAGASAVGGIFGDLNGPPGSGTLRVFNASGELFDTREVSYGDMGAGLAKTFFGWASDEIQFTALEFSIFDSADFSAMDDFRFGSAVSPLPPVPLPAGIWLFISALAGLVGLGRLRQA